MSMSISRTNPRARRRTSHRGAPVLQARHMSFIYDVMGLPHPTCRHATALLLLTFAGAGCKRGAPGAPPAASAGASAAAPSPYEPLVVKFADQANAGIFAYAKREHILEREL